MFKVSDKHWEIFCTFMENHTDVAVGRLNVPSARDTHKKLWKRLTVELNADCRLGGRKDMDRLQIQLTALFCNSQRHSLRNENFVDNCRSYEERTRFVSPFTHR